MQIKHRLCNPDVWNYMREQNIFIFVNKLTPSGKWIPERTGLEHADIGDSFYVWAIKAGSNFYEGTGLVGSGTISGLVQCLSKEEHKELYKLMGYTDGPGGFLAPPSDLEDCHIFAIPVIYDKTSAMCNGTRPVLPNGKSWKLWQRGSIISDKTFTVCDINNINMHLHSI